MRGHSIAPQVGTHIARKGSTKHVVTVAHQRVFGFGNNLRGCLGLGHDSPILSPQIIPQLCHQNIQYFVNGSDFVLAMNDINIIYGFSSNFVGQLARSDHIGKECLKPEIISHFNDINIKQISCGIQHTLALSSDGRVYAWGWNNWGQIGCGDNNEYICTPIEIQFKNSHKIQSIYCSYLSSFAITSDGHVFSWGDNDVNQLGYKISDEKVFIPRMISSIDRVKTIVVHELYLIKLHQYFWEKIRQKSLQIKFTKTEFELDFYSKIKLSKVWSQG
ncbi:unnamed protein product [Medioppia subpectinata]|uniref:Uncharacterized protein n=1 Tax=Medioppia subpectinata TaxID=1979941 RepID=A0A7R9KBB6_9ACAR|nr:unnamed protein product [Medioppia subpectinata]CAG2100143.1 unnamed protein product [Medioppia subpectinata]